MENRNNIIIGILVLIILILACVMGAMFLPHSNAQKDSKIVITGNKTLYAGDNLTVKLTDLNKTPIEHEVVNVTVSDKEGKVVVEKSLKTNSKGKASMNLDLDAGKYTVNATFGGNDNFTGNNATKKITIEEVVEEEPVVQQTSSESSNQSSGNELVSSRDFESWDYYPGHNIVENTYANGDIEHYYDDGSYDYYDSSSQEWKYRGADGSTGSMYVGN